MNPTKATAAMSALQGGLNLAKSVVSYEDQLARNPDWGLNDASLFFEDKGAVRAALRGITAKLRELEVEYAVIGALALFQHGLRRFTEVVELLVTRQGLRKLHQSVVGAGYVPAFTGSKHLRETEHGVKIEFFVAGEFPGDGKPKPVVFPDPATVAVECDSIQYLSLLPLVELKLASGISRPDRMGDLAEIHELIKILNLPVEFAEKLNPFVRDKFAELWTGANSRENCHESEFLDAEEPGADTDARTP